MPTPFRWLPLTDDQNSSIEDTTFNLLCCGQGGSGKTYEGAAKAWLVGAYYPNSCIGLVRKKRVDLKDTLWKYFTDRIEDRSLVVKSNESTLYRKLQNGSEFYGVGLDSSADVNKLASREYNFVVVEEATEITSRDYDEKIVRTIRLTNKSFLQCMLLCNPGAPTNWLYKRFYLNEVKDPSRWKLIESKTLPPPYLPQQWITFMQGLTGIFHERYVLGHWVGAEGIVYPFDPKKHIKPFKELFPQGYIPDDWQRVVAIDFGFSLDHAMCVQWWVITPDGKWICYRQIYVTGKRVEEMAPLIRRHMEKDGILGQSMICDHDADGRATLNAHNIKTRPAKKRRLAGQQVVHGLIANDCVFFVENNLLERDIDLQINEYPTCTEQEFGTYVWANKEKEDMITKRDHGMDTMRMAMLTILGGIEKPIDIRISEPRILQK